MTLPSPKGESVMPFSVSRMMRLIDERYWRPLKWESRVYAVVLVVAVIVPLVAIIVKWPL